MRPVAERARSLARKATSSAARVAVRASTGVDPVVVKRAAVAVAAVLVGFAVVVLTVIVLPAGSFQVSTDTATDIPPGVLEGYVDAGEEYGLPWVVLAGIGYTQSDHGRTAPGETVVRADPGDPPSDKTGTSPGGTATIKYLAGDSLMVGVAGTAGFTSTPSTAVVGASITDTRGQLTSVAAGSTVAVSAGANDLAGGGGGDQAAKVLAAVDATPAGCVVWSTVQTVFPTAGPRDYRGTIGRAGPAFNEALGRAAAQRPGKLVVVDWAAIVDRDRALAAKPGDLHLTGAGYQRLGALYQQGAGTCTRSGGRLTPTLEPPITEPGAGLYLAKSPGRYGDPVSVRSSSMAVAEQLAELVDEAAQEADVDLENVLGAFDPEAPATIDADVWKTWVGAVDELEVHAAASAPGGLGTAAMSRAATYAKKSAGAAGVSGEGGVGGLVAGGVPDTAARAYAQAAELTRRELPACTINAAFLAGFGKVESGHGTFGGARMAANGDVTPLIVGPVLDGSGNGGNTTPMRNQLSAAEQTEFGITGPWDRAVGPMQFLVSTWRQSGRDGNADGRRWPHNYFDAAYAAGVYLCNAGDQNPLDPVKMRKAILAYNGSEAYYQQVRAEYERIGAFAPPAGAPAGGGAVPAGGLMPSPVGPVGPDQVVSITASDGSTGQVYAPAAPLFNALFAAAKADGVALGISSSWRAPAQQIAIREERCPGRVYDPGCKGSPPVAVPGKSYHEWGVAIDFAYQGRTLCYPRATCQPTTNAGYDWMQANAARFGLTKLRSEAWHFSAGGR